MGNLLDSVQCPNIIERVDTRREAAVQTEYLVVDESGKGKIVKEIREEFPHISITILAQALVVETVYLCDLSRLVISSKNGDAVGVSNLESNQQRYGLDGIVAPVDVVT